MKRSYLFLLCFMISVFTLNSCSKSKMYKPGDLLKTTEQTVGTVTESDFDEMISLSSAKDATGFSDMILTGKMFVIESGTQCRVLETSVGKIKCDLMIAGEDRKLWINSKFLK